MFQSLLVLEKSRNLPRKINFDNTLKNSQFNLMQLKRHL